ncbi:MAG: hypothetical protein IJY40_04520 [Oscillospiraceae bacterium]|nr:hypothetical protein [Oscillospiraceae bacterium]
MRLKHWKLLPCFLLGLVAMQTVGWGVAVAFGTFAGLRKLHWAIWLILSLAFPILALLVLGRVKDGRVPRWYTVSYLFSVLGAGWAYGICLAFLEVPLTLGDMLISTALPALVAVVMCLTYTLWRRTRFIAIGFTILTVAAIFCCLIFGEGKGMLALGGIFGLLFFASMPVTCGKVLCGEDWREQMAFSGFGAYLIVLVGAIVLLLEDGIDGFEGLFEGITDAASGLEPQPQPKQKRH